MPPSPPGLGRVHDLGAADDAGQRHAAGQALGDADQIGLDVVMLHREQLAGPAEAGLDFVGDQHDAVFVADPAQRPHQFGRRLWKPPSPWTGSTMIAATRAGSIRP